VIWQFFLDGAPISAGIMIMLWARESFLRRDALRAREIEGLRAEVEMLGRAYQQLCRQHGREDAALVQQVEPARDSSCDVPMAPLPAARVVRNILYRGASASH
jgi:hypothetical protein